MKWKSLRLMLRGIHTTTAMLEVENIANASMNHTKASVLLSFQLAVVEYLDGYHGGATCNHAIYDNFSQVPIPQHRYEHIHVKALIPERVQRSLGQVRRVCLFCIDGEDGKTVW
jgi:hypothetical protein